MSTADQSHDQLTRVITDVKAHLDAIASQAERIFGHGSSDSDRAVEAIRAHIPEAHAKLDSVLPERTAPTDDQDATQ